MVVGPVCSVRHRALSRGAAAALLLLAAVLPGAAGAQQAPAPPAGPPGAAPSAPAGAENEAAAAGFAPLRLAVASNFSQDADQNLFIPAATRLGVGDVRDGMRWGDVERMPGRYSFALPRTSYPDRLAQAGIGLSVVVNFGNRIYDDGATPQSPATLAAQARYVAALVDRFPALHTIEVGNEFNGVNFVRGPLKEASPGARADAHVAILRAIHGAVGAGRRDGGRPVRVLGGAAHSIPLAYLWRILDAGGRTLMDAMAIHPYSSLPEDFPKQVAVLRRHPAARDLPLQVTEFGAGEDAAAPAILARWLAVMAVSGVERAVWYPLNERRDGLVPLVDAAGAPTAAGRGYAFALARLAGRPAHDVSPDPYTFAAVFGDDTLVLWGERRTVTPAPGVRAAGPDGTALSGPLVTDPRTPLVLEGGGETLAAYAALGDNGVIADSAYDFAYPAADGSAPPGPLERLIRDRAGGELAFETMPGQERDGVPWTPYLGRADRFPLRMTSSALLPRGGRGAAEVVQRYTAATAGEVDVAARFAPSERSKDGIAVRVTHNDTPLLEESGREAVTFAQRLSLAAGDRLEFVVGANGSHEGDATRYRIRIGRPGALAAPTLR